MTSGLLFWRGLLSLTKGGDGRIRKIAEYGIDAERRERTIFRCGIARVVGCEMYRLVAERPGMHGKPGCVSEFDEPCRGRHLPCAFGIVGRVSLPRADQVTLPRTDRVGVFTKNLEGGGIGEVPAGCSLAGRDDKRPRSSTLGRG